MSFDLSQFNQLFFEETAEHLATMESLMLNMDVQSPDMDDLNAVFRAAHSIKGNSGTFGFNDMTAVTHELETLLDLVRKGETDLTDEMVDVTLQAGDVLGGMLEAHQNGEEPDQEPAKAVIEELNRQLAIAKGGDFPQSEPQSGQTFAEELPPQTEATQSALTQSYLIRFPAPDQELDMLFDSLKELGDLTIIDAPSEDSNDWLFSLQTDSAKDDLKDLITFMVPEDNLSIEEELSADDGSFGFFETVGSDESSDDDVGYGFFDDLELSDDKAPQAAAKEDDDPGFGFFDDEPEEASSDSSDKKDSTQPDSDKSDADPGYGFFDEPEESSAKEMSSSSDKSSEKEQKSDKSDQGTEFDGYGFFEPLKNQPAAKQENSSAKSADKPAPAKVETAKSRSAKPAAAAAVKGGGADSSIRVSVEKVDQLINQVGELVITQAMLAQMASEVDPILHEKMANGLAQLERNTRDLQDSVMSIRMMPISIVFSRFPRVVRDLAGKLNKKVKLEMVGENTELDRSMIEKLTDPLTHLIRNSLDHGIESPEARAAAGKDQTGTILLRASHQGGNIVVEVQDDGAGLNRERILSKAQEKGIAVSENMPDSEVWQLIFAPGFSTAAAVTDVSGRGVGMDVVKRNITSLGGRLEIESMEGIGSRISIRLPLTLAILDGLQVALGDEIYIVPLTSIIGSMQPDPNDIKTVSGEGAVINVRDEYLPIIKLGELLNMPAEFNDYEQGIMVVLESDGKRVGLFVDDLVGQSQVVIKSLEANYRKVDGVSGATILGTGRVALILDVEELISMHKKRAKKKPSGMLVQGV
ncbi:chemotaxis protein CheW [Oceanospirillum sanctuarii]|uniref:chemotaxis protein CheW n=1 Tax=Oceanospirillum sanctuarii TaxID=1434821 RepID=UPI000A37A5E9|nr:chemotaxis protein CheW [Oceanospirillum sanctuarii]